MKRKWLAIGISITAVILITLTSITNVVGYQSVRSTVNDSPLFTIRTMKAINKESNVLTSDYLGKGLNALQFPLRDDRTALIQRVIERIGRMSDIEFNRFKSLILSRFYEEKQNLPIDTTQFITILKQLKYDTKEQKIVLNNNGNNTNNNPPTMLTAYGGCCPILENPLCIIIMFFLIIIQIFIIIYCLLSPFWTAVPYTFCGPACVNNQNKQYFLGG